MSNNVTPRRGVLRARQEPATVGAIELFFDLVYVFTIIQLSHSLLAHLSWTGLLETAVLFGAVWWGWNYTAWSMNWLSPEHAVVRILMALLMLPALAMALAIPEAFDGRGALFVGGYLLLQLGRSAFMVWAFRGQRMGRNYLQLWSWSAIAGVLWVAGLFAGEAQLWVWLAALVVDYAAPRLAFWLPGLGTAPMSSWPLDEDHLAERNRLVFIIALGESILIIGFTLAESTWTAGSLVSAVVGFATIVLLWALYFSYRAGNAEHAAAAATEATRLSRGAYAYAHALMVGGAIVVAVGIELVIAHPWDPASLTVAGVVVGGPAVYLLGNLAFNIARYRRLPYSRLVALAALAALLLAGPLLPALVLSTGVMLVLAVLSGATGELRAAAA